MKNESRLKCCAEDNLWLVNFHNVGALSSLNSRVGEGGQAQCPTNLEHKTSIHQNSYQVLKVKVAHVHLSTRIIRNSQRRASVD
jgi:hypothetical protein